MRHLLTTATTRLRDLTGSPGGAAGANVRSGLGAISAFAIRVISAGLALVMSIALARWLGAREFGIFTYVWVWVNVLGTLCTLGFATSAIRFLPGYALTGDHASARGFLRTGRWVSLAAGTLCAVLGLALVFFADGLVAEHYVWPLAVGLCCLPAFAMTDFQDGIGRARSWLVLALAPPYILRPLLIVAIVAIGVAAGWGRNAATAVIAAIVATWAVAVIQFALQQRRLRPEAAGAGPPSFAVKLWLRVSIPALLLESFSLLMLNLDIMLLDLFVEPDQIAIYFAAARIISLMAFVHFAVTAVAMPRFAAAHAAGDVDAISEILSRTRKWMLLPSLAGAAGLLVLGKPLLWLFGSDFTAGFPVMFVLVAGLLARAAAGPVQGLLTVTGHHNATAVTMAGAVVVNLTLNVLLIPEFGLMGAAFATSAAFVIESIALALLAARAVNQPVANLALPAQ